MSHIFPFFPEGRSTRNKRTINGTSNTFEYNQKVSLERTGTIHHSFHDLPTRHDPATTREVGTSWISPYLFVERQKPTNHRGPYSRTRYHRYLIRHQCVIKLHLPKGRSGATASCWAPQRHRRHDGSAHRAKPVASRLGAGHTSAHLGRLWCCRLSYRPLRIAQNRVAQKHLLHLGHSRYCDGWYHTGPLVTGQPG